MKKRLIKKFSFEKNKESISIRGKENPESLVLDLRKIGIEETFLFQIHPEDIGLSKELLEKGFREPHYSRYHYDFIDSKDIVLDIGANLGYFTLLSKKASKIISFEPIEKAIYILSNNVTSNELSNKCEIINAAVGREKGELFFKHSNAFNASRIVKKSTQNSVPVKVLSLKDVVRKYRANALRLDLEGYEYELFLENIPKIINKISLEFHASRLSEKKLENLFRYLEKEGFKIDYLITFFPKKFEKYYLFFKKMHIEKFFVKIFKNLEINKGLDIIKKNKGNFFMELYAKYKLKKMRDCYLLLRRKS